MFSRVSVVGRGRVGAAIAARLRERGVSVTDSTPDLVVLCVPDRAIAEVASAIAPGPWLAHVSGAQSLAVLAPHQRRFTMHPLQTFDDSGRPEQFDGASAAIAAESPEGLALASDLAGLLGLQPFAIDDHARVAYHAGAAIASNYLVTLYRAASALFEVAGAPPAALVPLMQRTITNGFQLTGPIARGDWNTVAAHREAISEHAPQLTEMYDALAKATVR